MRRNAVAWPSVRAGAPTWAGGWGGFGRRARTRADGATGVGGRAGQSIVRSACAERNFGAKQRVWYDPVRSIPTMRPSLPLVTSVLLASVVTWVWWDQHSEKSAAAPLPAAPTCAAESSSAGPDGRSDANRWGDRLGGHSLQLPTGMPAHLSCRDARRVIGQVRLHLASEPARVDPKLLTDATIDWLDPHGLWSASPDAPLGGFLHKQDKAFLAELESDLDEGPCHVARAAGELMRTWAQTLASDLDEEFRRAAPKALDEAFRSVIDPAFEDHAVVRPARQLAAELGRSLGIAALSFKQPIAPFVQAARDRFVPSLTAEEWSEAVLAAALRAYLPQIDPHGGWAPLDEETSLYEVDLEASPPPRLWDHMVRTVLGVRVESEPIAPLEVRDLVLEVGPAFTAGLSVEQVEQLAIVDSTEDRGVRSVTVLRQGASEPIRVEIQVPEEPEREEAAATLAMDRVRYGNGEVVVIEVGDVPDDLGDLLTSTIAKARAEGMPRGIVLDLRGNGGGSTDGANAALGLFLPGAPLFPMRRRDGVVETERAPEPPETDRWLGPLAVVVDGDTASAAEMIAGALASYRRGSVAGVRTYGKGCAQEYLDDEVHTGVLRLTTLIYALPDGTPVQRVGLQPGLNFGRSTATEREASLAHALPTWRGPDVRDRTKVGGPAWPPHRGRVGPCRDETICRTLRALGTTRSSVARGPR